MILMIELAAACIILFPLFWAVCTAMKEPWEIVQNPGRIFPDRLLNLSNYAYVISHVPFLRYFLNSVLCSVFVCLVRLFLSALSAFTFVFYSFRARKALYFLILSTLMIPPDVLVIINYKTIASLSLTDTYLGICSVSFLGATQMFMLHQSFSQAPSSLRDASLMDGCSDMRFLFSILMPQCRGISLTLLMQIFLSQWNAYLWPLLVTNKTQMRTLQIGITMLQNAESTNYEQILSGVIMALIAPVILSLLLRRLLYHVRNASVPAE